jgi:hypothetical protein
MALTDIRNFNFYQKYLWSPTDFQNLQQWLRGSIEGLFEGLTGAAVLDGLVVSPGGGMTLTVSTGIAVNENGRMVVVSPSLSTTITAPTLNPRRDLLILRPKVTNTTLIPQPTNPSNQVPLHQQFGYDFLLLNGAQGVNPAYPATQAGDIVLAGVYSEPSTTVLTQANLDIGVTDRPRKRRSRVKVLKGNSAISVNDDIIELDCSNASGTFTLPGAKAAEGRHYTIIRVDNSSNDCVVSGGDGINGTNTVELDTQYQKLNLYSNAITWRSI